MLKTMMLLGALAFGQNSGILDGTEWAMTFKPAQVLSFSSKTDRLKFYDGQLSSEAALEDGYLSTDYETTSWGAGFSWRATQTNPKGERTAWRGTALGDRMEGTFTRLLIGGREVRYRWTARMRKGRPRAP